MLGLVDCLGVGGAAVHGGGEVVLLREGGGLGRIHHGGAVMHSVPPAAGRKQRCEVGTEREKRRDQREADEEDEQDGEGTPHAASLSENQSPPLTPPAGLWYSDRHAIRAVSRPFQARRPDDSRT
jgi:hypothetical protein